jgi:hypothetical protein
MRRLQPATDLQAEIQGFAQRQSAAPGQRLRQQLAREELGDDVDQSIVSLAQLMDRSDIRMLDSDCVTAALPE